MKKLLIVTAILEVGAGLAFAAAPSTVARLLLGDTLEPPVGPIVGRVLGAALLAIGTACCLTRDSAAGRAAAGLVAAVLLYNVAVASLLGYAGIALGAAGVGLWPAVLLHSALAAWCVACLRIAQRDGGAGSSTIAAIPVEEATTPGR